MCIILLSVLILKEEDVMIINCNNDQTVILYTHHFLTHTLTLRYIL